MGYVVSWIWIIRYLVGSACVLALSPGCGEDGNGAGGAGGTGGTGGTETATLKVFPVGPDEHGDYIPLADVELCEVGTTHCATSNEDGVATLQVPANQEISYTIEKPGYGSELRADIIDLSGSVVLPTMATDEQLAFRYNQVVSPYPMEGNGSIWVQVYGGQTGLVPIAGATVTLLGASDKRFYVDEANDWRLDLTETTSVGVGGFVEVSRGDYQIEIGGVTGICELVRGWPGDSNKRIRVPVRAGYMTIARVNCG